MILDDIEILIKKIAVGVIVYLIPVFIIVGGLWLSTVFLKKDKTTTATKEISLQP